MGGIDRHGRQRFRGGQPELEAAERHRKRQVWRGRCPGVEVGAQGDGHARIDQPAGGSVVAGHEEQRRDRQERGDHRMRTGNRACECLYALIGDRPEVVRRERSDLRGELRPARWHELVRVQSRQHAQAIRGGQDPPAVGRVEDPLLAEDVAEPGAALGRDSGQLLFEDRAYVGILAVGSGTELGGHRMRSQVGRQHVDGAHPAELECDLDEPELRRQVEAVAGLGLDGRDAVSEHLGQPAPTVVRELLLAGGAGRGNRREDAAAGRQDLEVAGTTLA